MNAVLQALIELQETMRAIAERERVQGAIPARLAELDRRLQEAAAGLERAREEAAQAQKDRRRLELDVASIEERIRRHQDQILTVKSNEAYRALQHEIEQERARISAIEDQILDILERGDALAARIRDLEKDHGTEKLRVEEQKRKVQEEADAAGRERDRLLAVRADCERRLSAEVLDNFHRIARARGGVAVVPARNELCGGCNVRLRPQLYQELRRGEALLVCDSCKRYVYVPEEPRTPSADSGAAPAEPGEGHAPA